MDRVKKLQLTLFIWKGKWQLPVIFIGCAFISGAFVYLKQTTDEATSYEAVVINKVIRDDNRRPDPYQLVQVKLSDGRIVMAKNIFNRVFKPGEKIIVTERSNNLGTKQYNVVVQNYE